MNTANHEYYVSLELAKLLKEVGFKWFINTAYRDGVLMRQGNLLCDNFNGKQYENAARHEFFSAPTLDVAQRWLRENLNLIITVEYNEYNYQTFLCKVYSNEECLSILLDFPIYEEAQEAGIKKALEIILEKGE